MPLLLAVAHATEPAFECDPLATPADGRKYADPWGPVEAVFDRLVAAVQAEFEPGCPRLCDTGTLPPGDCYADDCVTAGGTHVVVDYRVERDTGTYAGGTEATWSVEVTPASGEALTLSSAYTSEYGRGGGHGSDSDAAWTWSATWSGVVDTELPADRSVAATLTASSSIDGYYGWYYADSSAAWDDGVCTWDAADEVSDFDIVPRTSWGIHVGAQTLTVSESTSACDAAYVRTATLDGVASQVVDPDWTPLVDADGDGVDASVDCDDAAASVHPCAEEVAGDGVDQDCDGVDPADADGDGSGADVDCDDSDPGFHPGADDPPCDGLDQDCSRAEPWDYDDDGVEASCSGGADCDDTDPTVGPGATDVVDGVDQDCDGVDGVDADGDGYASEASGGLDCDDTRDTSHPGAEDRPGDGRDQDCDGVDAVEGEDTAEGAATGAVDDTAAEVPDDDADGPKEEEGGCASAGLRRGGLAAWLAAVALAMRRRRAVAR